MVHAVHCTVTREHEGPGRADVACCVSIFAEVLVRTISNHATRMAQPGYPKTVCEQLVSLRRETVVRTRACRWKVGCGRMWTHVPAASLF